LKFRRNQNGKKQLEKHGAKPQEKGQNDKNNYQKTTDKKQK